jgi:hypothetical protein
MRRAFHTFIGVDLGGGKGKTTAVARLRLPRTPAPADDTEVVVEDLGAPGPWFDEQLTEYLLRRSSLFFCVNA